MSKTLPKPSESERILSLLQIMKEHKILKLKVKDVELELSPDALKPSLDEESSQEHLYPSSINPKFAPEPVMTDEQILFWSTGFDEADVLKSENPVDDSSQH